MRMAVCSFLVRSQCIFFHLKCILSKQTSQKVDLRKLHYCRNHHLRLRYSYLKKGNDTRISLLIPRRNSSRDANEQIPNPSEVWCAPEKPAVAKLSTRGRQADEGEGQQVTLDYFKGLPRITIPLPSRKENCRFTLKPISNTVGNLTTMIKEEDHGIDRVAFSSKDGVRIASSSNIELLLLEDEEFYITINDSRYRVSIPSTIREFFNKDDTEKLSDVQMLVSQLYEELHVGEYRAYKEQKLKSKLEKLQLSLAPLEQQRSTLEKKAEFRTSILTWIGLSMMGVQFGILARLTWWEYSWDIMEPVTYFVTYGTAMAMYAYFAITRQDYILPEIRDRQHLIALHKKARKCGFDLHQYNALKEQLTSVTADLERLQDPIKPYSSGTSSTTGISDSKHTSSTKKNDCLKPMDNVVNQYIAFLLNKIRKY